MLVGTPGSSPNTGGEGDRSSTSETGVVRGVDQLTERNDAPRTCTTWEFIINDSVTPSSTRCV